MARWTLASTALALVAFASNSLLCRAALRGGAIDWASFTAVRIASGALALAALLAFRPANPRAGRWPLFSAGSQRMAAALAAYAVAFSFAYLELGAGVGALLLFGSVQATMLAAGLRSGERPRPTEWGGLAIALAGLVLLVSPGLSAPAPAGAAAMIAAGVAWGFYSLWGRGAGEPTLATAGNFARAVPWSLAALAALAWVGSSEALYATPRGVALAVASGAVTSGLGYVVWYRALRGLTATRAAIVQLAVPILAALGGVALLGERVTWRLAISSALTLGGVALAIAGRARTSGAAAARPVER